MADAILKLATMLSVIVHAGFGCCAHHGHSDCSASATVSAPRQTIHSCSHHPHSHDHAEGSQHYHTAPESPCSHSHGDYGDCADHCAWLTGSKVRLPPTFHSSLLVSPAASHELPLLASSLTTITGGDSSITVPTGPVRAEVQIWRL
jgi:hypothetical protein